MRRQGPDGLKRGCCRRGAALLLLAAGCASGRVFPLFPSDETEPEAPTARLMRQLPPARMNELLPPPRVFAAHEWLDRLVCALGDPPAWQRVSLEGPVGTFNVECPGEPPLTLSLDTSKAAPPAPPGLRLMAVAGAAQYRSAMQQAEKQQWKEALGMLEAASAAAPDEPVYKRERLYLLLKLGRTPEALLQADELAAAFPTPLVWKYRALAARELGLSEEVLASIQGILATSPERHPLHAEGVCAKGMLLTSLDRPGGEDEMRRGCALGHMPCCTAMEERHDALERLQRAVEAAESLPVQLPQGPEGPEEVPRRYRDEPATAGAAPGPAETAAPEKAAETAAPVKTVETAASGKAAETAASGKAADTAASVKAAETAAPGKTAETAAPGKTAETAASGKTAETAASGKAAETAAPGKTAEPQPQGGSESAP